MKATSHVVDDYRIVVSGTEYTAPEFRRFHLQGECSWLHDRPKMSSSPIVSVKGRVVTTASGSRYILGRRADGFKTFAQLRKEYKHIQLG
jgi:hypothetical protein